MVTAVFVFPLLFLGAGVTSKDAGMIYPDWPTSDGHLLNPPNWWSGDHTRWEHGHRLIGWGVGLSSLVLAVLTWRMGGKQRRLGLGTLAAIAIQGVLGGLRVTEVSTVLAMIHGIWGQTCFCLAVLSALLTSRAWFAFGPARETRSGRAAAHLCAAATAAMLVQLTLGATLRHFTSGHALVAHVLWAIPVVFLTGWAVMWVLGLGLGRRPLEAAAQSTGLLLAVQLVLGGFAWLVPLAGDQWPAWLAWLVPSLHVVVGALLLASSVLLTTLVYTAIRPMIRHERRAALSMSMP
jgi:cytochrome c oxidase assembly protein subunit 15